MELFPGARVDRYEVVDVLGTGGMAVVYKVRHTTLGTHHALKVLHAPSRSMRERLLREGRAQAALRHPNIVAVNDVVEVDSSPGLLMEFVEGPTLRRFLQDTLPTWDQVDALARGMLRAVAHAHRAAVVHRDIKPANVLLSIRDRALVPLVTDFGIAKVLQDPDGQHATATGVAMGTPAYMAPEQFTDARSVDARADVYSLGAVLYEMCTGHMPFPQDDLMAIYVAATAGQVIDPAVHRPDLPPRMARAIRSAMDPDRDARCPTVDALLTLWEDARGEQPAPLHTPPGTWDEALLKRIRELPAGTPAAWHERPAQAAAPRAPSAEATADLGTFERDIAGTHRNRRRLGTALGLTVAGAAALWMVWPEEPPPRSSSLPPSIAEARPLDAPPPVAAAPEAPPDAPGEALDEPPAATPTAAGRPPSRATEAPPGPVEPAAPPPPVPTGRVAVQGDGAVTLVRDGRRYDPGPVPPGEYGVVVAFEGLAPRESGTIVVEADATSTLQCTAAFRKCTPLVHR